MALKEIPLEKAFGEGDSGYIPKYEKARIGMSLDEHEKLHKSKTPCLLRIPDGRVTAHMEISILDECEPLEFLDYSHYNDELNFD